MSDSPGRLACRKLATAGRLVMSQSITQAAITKERIEMMLSWRPRRMQIQSEWQEATHEPREADKDWSLVLPFCETLKNAFRAMCSVACIGLREGKNGRCYTFLTKARQDPREVEKVRLWLQQVGAYVALRDCLALSFALDYDRRGGNPDEAQTRVGLLRARAKPYDDAPSPDTYAAADELVRACLDFLKTMRCYQDADVLVGMPPSRVDKPFDLPAYLADGIARGLGKADQSARVKTVRTRPAVKDTALTEKLAALEGTITVDRAAFGGKTVLLVDDLYQAGVSMNYVGMLLLEAGARRVFGLAVEKTCRNDDNVAKRRKQ